VFSNVKLMYATQLNIQHWNKSTVTTHYKLHCLYEWNKCVTLSCCTINYCHCFLTNAIVLLKSASRMKKSTF